MKKVKLAKQVATDDLAEYVERVCVALDRPGALITDRSIVADMLEFGAKPFVARRGRTGAWVEHPGDPKIAKANEEMLRRASSRLGVPVSRSDYIVALARSVRDLARA